MVTEQQFANFLLGDELDQIMISERVSKQIVAISSDRVVVPEDDAPIEPGKGYFRFWMAGMNLRYQRRLFRDRFPAVKADVRTEVGSATATFTSLVSPAAMLDSNLNDANNIFLENRQLTPLIPFNGGTIDFRVGLVAMLGNQTLKQFTKAVSDISAAAAVSNIATALTVINTVDSTIGSMFDADRDQLKIAYAEQFTDGENRLVPGYVALINVPEGTYKDTDLWVKDDDLMVGHLGDHVNATRISNVDWLLIRIETVQSRLDELLKIKDIQEPYAKALKQVSETGRDGDFTIADAHIRTAILNAYTSLDLCESDHQRASEVIRDAYRIARGLLPIDGQVEDHDPTIDNLLEKRNAGAFIKYAATLHARSPYPRPQAGSMLDLLKVD